MLKSTELNVTSTTVGGTGVTGKSGTTDSRTWKTGLDTVDGGLTKRWQRRKKLRFKAHSLKLPGPDWYVDVGSTFPQSILFTRRKGQRYYSPFDTEHGSKYFILQEVCTFLEVYYQSIFGPTTVVYKWSGRNYLLLLSYRVSVTFHWTGTVSPHFIISVRELGPSDWDLEYETRYRTLFWHSLFLKLITTWPLYSYKNRNFICPSLPRHVVNLNNRRIVVP